jgi:hypothetical protein
MPDGSPATARCAKDSPARRSPGPDAQAADLSPNSRTRGRSAQRPRSQRLSSRGLSFPDSSSLDSSFPDSSSLDSFRDRRGPARKDQDGKDQGRRDLARKDQDGKDRDRRGQGRSTAARTAVASAALVRFPRPAALAGKARPGFTVRQFRAACRPASRARSRVSFRQVLPCRQHRSRPADRFRPGRPRRASSRPDTQTRVDPCPSASSRADLALLHPGRYRQGSSCRAQGCPTADRWPRDSSPRQGRSLPPARSPDPMRLPRRASSLHRVSSVPASCPVSQCQAGSSARPSTACPDSTDRPLTSDRPARLPWVGQARRRSRRTGSLAGRPGRDR